ncbi:MAG: hypothetical protein ACRDQA_17490 [Nocardioidaceae bacterium]
MLVTEETRPLHVDSGPVGVLELHGLTSSHERSNTQEAPDAL